MQSSGGGVSPVRLMKVARAGLDHGDILVMDGQCQDEFLHHTDPWLGTGMLRSGGSNNMFPRVLCLRQEWHACLPTCAQGSSVPVMENVASGVFWGFLASCRCLVHMESASFAGIPVVYKAWVTWVCLLLDTPLGADVGRGITFVASERILQQFIKMPTFVFGFM